MMTFFGNFFATFKENDLLNLEAFNKIGTLSKRIDYAWDVIESNNKKYKPLHKDAAWQFLTKVYGTKSRYISYLMQLKHENTDKNYIPTISEIPRSIIDSIDENISEQASKKLMKALRESNELDLIDSFKELNQTVSDYYPEIGPLPKSVYTEQYESLVKRLMSDDNFNCKIENGQQYIEFLGDNKLYNLTQIASHANLTHLEFNQVDFARYEQYIKEISFVSAHLPSKEDFLRQEHIYLASKPFLKGTSNLYGGLSYAEKLSIYLYTTPYCHDINSFLRGIYPYEEKHKNLIRDVIIHSAFAGSALAHLPKTRITSACRYEKIYNQDVLDNRIALAEHGGSEILRGFVSTGMRSLSPDLSLVQIIYTNLMGHYVAPLSAFQGEEEFLLPPTQMIYTGYVNVNGKHCFLAEPIVDLAGLSEEVKSMPTQEEKDLLIFDRLIGDLRNISSIMEQHNPEQYVIHKDEVDSLTQWASELSVNVHDQGATLSPDNLLFAAQCFEKLSDLSQYIQISNYQKLQEEYTKKSTSLREQSLASAATRNF